MIEQQTKPRTTTRKEIIKISTAVNDVKTKITLEPGAVSFLKKIKKNDKPLARRIKKKRKYSKKSPMKGGK